MGKKRPEKKVLRGKGNFPPSLFLSSAGGGRRWRKTFGGPVGEMRWEGREGEGGIPEERKRRFPELVRLNPTAVLGNNAATTKVAARKRTTQKKNQRRVRIRPSSSPLPKRQTGGDLTDSVFSHGKVGATP